MYSTYFETPACRRDKTAVFYGLNRRPAAADGEFADMENLSSDAFPLLSPRAPRAFLRALTRPNGLNTDLGFAFADGADFYFGGKKVEGVSLSDGEKNIVAFGAYLLIFPDGIWYDTINKTHGEIEQGGTETGALSFSQIRTSKWIYKPDDEPERLRDSEWDIGNSKNSLLFPITVSLSDYKKYDELPDTVQTYRYSEPMLSLVVCGGAFYYPKKAVWTKDISEAVTEWRVAQWQKVEAEAVRVPADGAPACFPAANLWSGNAHVHPVKVTASSGDYYNFDLTGADGLFDLFEGFDSKKINYRWKYRTLPVLDYVCVSGNRLWGCHFGTQVNGFEPVNEIYCSELGDFRKWETGTGADKAWTAAVGAYGEWTGCISYRGYALFFKEDAVLRVTGTKPGNFQYAQIASTGVAAGCARSLCVVGEVLYYKGRNGIYAYDGSLPARISDKLGSLQAASGAAAGGTEDKYYICLSGALCVYDAARGLWHMEDGGLIRFFARYGGALYGIAGRNLVCFSGTPDEQFENPEAEDAVKWYAETGDIGLDMPEQKFYRSFVLRASGAPSARLTVEILADGCDWRHAADFVFDGIGSVVLPVTTPRCDHMRIRFSGRGDVKIYSIAYTAETADILPERRIP